MSISFYPLYHWTASIGKAEATGNEKTSAIQALKRIIESAFDGDYSPLLLMFRGHVAIAWRMPEYWAYQIFSPDTVSQKEGVLTQVKANSSYGTKKALEDSLRFHLAQNAWDGEEEQSPVILKEEDQSLFTGLAREWKRYKQLAAQNLDDAAICEQLRIEGL